MAAPSLLSTLLLLITGVGIARISAGRLARWAVPGIVLELLVGFVLGNTVLPYEAIEPLSGLTELGVLTLFFQVGLEVRADLLISRRLTILRLVALSFLTPLLAYWPLRAGFGMSTAQALLCMAALAATGTGVSLRVLAQRQVLHMPSARLLVGVSVLDDLPAIGLLSLATATAGVSLGSGGSGGWSSVLGLMAAALSYRVTIWWTRHRPERPRGALAILMMLIGTAWVGEASGLTSLLGALWGGVLISRLAPPEEDVNRTLGVLSDVFLPLYFIGVGMRIEAGTLLEPASWTLACVLVVLGILSKLACVLGVSRRDRADGVDPWIVVFGLIPRGLPGLVFATTALGVGLINARQFSSLVIMVTVTTVVGLLLLEARLSKPTDQEPGLAPFS